MGGQNVHCKVSVILFSRKRNSLEQKFDGQDLMKGKDVQILGTIFDFRLVWQDHVQYGVEKCNKRINMLKGLAGFSRKTCFHWFKK